MASASGYFLFVALSFPFLAIESVVSACFRASGNTRITLMVSIILNVINIGGNATLIYGFHMGATGAAISTAFARLIGAVILLFLGHQKKYAVHFENTLKYKPDLNIIKRILRIGIPNGIESSMFQFGRLLTQTLISTMETGIIAANAVALTISGYQYMTGTACSTAMIPIVGRCIGAKDERQAKYYSKVILALDYVLIWVVIATTFILMNPIVSLYDLSESSSAIAKNLITYHAIFAMVVWPVGFMLPSAFRVAGDVKFSLGVSMFTMWVFRVAGAYLCALEKVNVLGLFTIPGLNMGIYGVWFAMTVDWVFRSSLFLVHYIRGKWLRKKL
jgi:putative MATE family efflux protein